MQFDKKHDNVREVVMNTQKMMATDRWMRGFLPSVESLNCIFRLSWSCSFLMKVIPLHSIKQSVSCVTTLGICLSNVSFSEHLFASAAGRNGDKRPKDTSTVKYILSRIIQTSKCLLRWAFRARCPLVGLLFRNPASITRLHNLRIWN